MKLGELAHQGKKLYHANFQKRKYRIKDDAIYAFSSHTTPKFLSIFPTTLEEISAVAGWYAGLRSATTHKWALVLQLLLGSLCFFNVFELIPVTREPLVYLLLQDDNKLRRYRHSDLKHIDEH
jgi:hypothetical protein